MRENKRNVIWFFMVGILAFVCSGVSAAEAKSGDIVTKNAGYYQVESVNKKDYAFGVSDSSVVEKTKISVSDWSDSPTGIWKLEKEGKKKFRLKNVNSGLYLSLSSVKSKEGSTLVQKKYKKSDKTMLFQTLEGKGKKTYIRNVANKQYLYVSGNSLCAGKKKQSAKYLFTWKKASLPASKVKLSGYTYPVSVNYGEPFVLKGSISSNYTILWVRVQIVGTSGNHVQFKELTPNKCKVNISEADASIRFGSLEPGTYHYQVWVRDSTKVTKMLADKTFTVVLPTGTGIGSANKTLFYNEELISQIGHQSNGTDLEKKACASYALAYCNAIVKGVAEDPHYYWLSETAVDCVWSKGGYVTQTYASEKKVLEQAYVQINAGYPTILHVMGNTPQHWVTVIGYKNVLSMSGLSAANIIAIDPWDGAVFTLSDRYQVKSTYRLGVQNARRQIHGFNL